MVRPLLVAFFMVLVLSHAKAEAIEKRLEINSVHRHEHFLEVVFGFYESEEQKIHNVDTLTREDIKFLATDEGLEPLSMFSLNTLAKSALRVRSESIVIMSDEQFDETQATAVRSSLAELMPKLAVGNISIVMARSHSLETVIESTVVQAESNATMQKAIISWPYRKDGGKPDLVFCAVQKTFERWQKEAPLQRVQRNLILVGKSTQDWYAEIIATTDCVKQLQEKKVRFFSVGTADLKLKNPKIHSQHLFDSSGGGVFRVSNEQDIFSAFSHIATKNADQYVALADLNALPSKGLGNKFVVQVNYHGELIRSAPLEFPLFVGNIKEDALSQTKPGVMTSSTDVQSVESLRGFPSELKSWFPSVLFALIIFAGLVYAIFLSFRKPSCSHCFAKPDAKKHCAFAKASAFLTILNGPYAGIRLPLKKGINRIGHHGKCHLRLARQILGARGDFIIKIAGRRIVLQTLRSNIRVNGWWCREPTLLGSGHVINFAKLHFRLELVEDAGDIT